MPSFYRQQSKRIILKKNVVYLDSNYIDILPEGLKDNKSVTFGSENGSASNRWLLNYCDYQSKEC